MKVSTNQKVVIISQVALASRDSFKEYSCFQKNFLDHMVTNPFNFWYHFLPNWEQSDFMYSLLETHYISLESISIFLKPKVIFFKKKKKACLFTCLCVYMHTYIQPFIVGVCACLSALFSVSSHLPLPQKPTQEACRMNMGHLNSAASCIWMLKKQQSSIKGSILD